MLKAHVAPFAGTWIEIGLKKLSLAVPFVAPFAGAWIEIRSYLGHTDRLPVAPFAGAWIEIKRLILYACTKLASLPSRERGLK